MSTSDDNAGSNELSKAVKEWVQKTDAQEEGKAMESNLPHYVDTIQATLMDLLTENFNELKDSLTVDMGKDKAKKGCSYNKFMAYKPQPFNGRLTGLFANGGSPI
jgi:hypothetical protein